MHWFFENDVSMYFAAQTVKCCHVNRLRNFMWRTTSLRTGVYKQWTDMGLPVLVLFFAVRPLGVPQGPIFELSYFLLYIQTYCSLWCPLYHPGRCWSYFFLFIFLKDDLLGFAVTVLIQEASLRSCMPFSSYSHKQFSLKSVFCSLCKCIISPFAGFNLIVPPSHLQELFCVLKRLIYVEAGTALQSFFV